jgi:predicted GNAT family N-acyltransferase
LIQIVSYPEPATPPELRAQVLSMQRDEWPSPGPDAEFDHDPTLQPQSMLLVDDGTVLAALDILFKELVHAGHRYRAAGLSTVVTRRDARGQGHGLRLVTAARRAMAASPLDLGVFTCDRPLQGFYERAGWGPIPGAVIMGGTRDNPFPSDQPGFDKVTMGAFFSPRARSHELSFHDSTIELYPGEIDKLW